jgi:hypothetical protein
MSRLYKLLLVTVLALFILACSLISGPVSDIENAASTAQAFASEMPLETLESLTTAIPVQTLEALPSAFPDIGNYFNPTGTPVDQWNGVPVMPEATAGEEFSETTYGYTVPASATDVEAFYAQEMEGLGWTSSFSLPVTDEGGILLFQNENDLLTITITPDQDDPNSVDVILQK